MTYEMRPINKKRLAENKRKLRELIAQGKAAQEEIKKKNEKPSLNSRINRSKRQRKNANPSHRKWSDGDTPMREIKFRAWLLEKKQMVIVDSLNIKSIHYTFLMPDFEGGFLSTLRIAFFDGIKLMQYTGLKDSKGKKIFESDIIDTFFYMGKVIVSFINGCFVIHNLKEDGKLLGWPEICTTDSKYDTLCRGASGYEVIGNIYENPELLKQLRI